MRQSDLANALSISMSTISHWEKSRRFPSVIEIKRIADFFEVDVNVLLNPSYENLTTKDNVDPSYSAVIHIPAKIFGLGIFLGLSLSYFLKKIGTGEGVLIRSAPCPADISQCYVVDGRMEILISVF